MVTVYTTGTWDLFHIGHLNILRRSKKLGDKLIVGVSTDELVNSYKENLVIPFVDRAEIIQANKYVDEVVSQHKLMDISQLIEINPDIVTIGSDWKDKYLEGLEWFKQQPNKKVVYLDYTGRISSTTIRNKLFGFDMHENLLKPKLFTIGCHESRDMMYNRSPEFSKLYLKLQDGLKELFKTKNDVYILTSSGTGAMECVITNILSKGDEVLVVNGGPFGQRWAEICKCFGIHVKELKVEFGKSIKPTEIEANLAGNIKAVFVTHNETSSCNLTDVKTIGEIVKKSNALFVVDAISSFLGEELEVDNWGIDVVISSSQKALLLPPGLSFISLSEKAWKSTSDLPKYYFDLRKYKSELIRGQTPFTPAISLILQLSRQINKRYSFNSSVVRNSIVNLGYSLVGENPSNYGTAFYANDAPQIIEAFKKEKILVNPSAPPYDKSIIRVAITNAEDAQHFSEILKKITNEMNFKIREKDELPRL